MENPCDEQVSKALWENNKRHVEQIERLLAETREECAQRLDALVKQWRKYSNIAASHAPMASWGKCADDLAELAAAIRSHKEGI